MMTRDSLRRAGRSHLLALRRLRRLYLRPRTFDKQVSRRARTSHQVTFARATLFVLGLFAHAIPYILLICIGGRGVYALALDLSLSVEQYSDQLILGHVLQLTDGLWTACLTAGIYGVVFWLVTALTQGRAAGSACGIALSISLAWKSGWAAAISLGIVTGLIISLASRLVRGIRVGLHFGICVGLVVSLALALAFGINEGFERTTIYALAAGAIEGLMIGAAFGIVAAMARGTLGTLRGGAMFAATFGMLCIESYSRLDGQVFGLTHGLAFAGLFFLSYIRAQYLPLHFAVALSDDPGARYSRHPIAFDELSMVPMPGLPKVLIAYGAHDRGRALAEIRRIIARCPPYRRAAHKALIALVAQHLGRESNLTEIRSALAMLPEAGSGLMARVGIVRQMITRLHDDQLRFLSVNRPYFRKLLAEAVHSAAATFKHTISEFPEPWASEFTPVSGMWLQITEEQLNAAQKRAEGEPTPQVFRAGDPIDRFQEAFVPRYSVVEELERQLTHATSCPGILLHGRRRMGKSTILKNLDEFLPDGVYLACTDMEDLKVRSSVESFVRHIATLLGRTLGVPFGESVDLLGLRSVLSECNNTLGETNTRLIIALDEFEYIDQEIQRGRFCRELLPLFRTSMQHDRHLTWIFAGSHTLDELSQADWLSYFVGVRTIEVPAFTQDETRALITNPLRFSSVVDRKSRPDFGRLWGQDTIQRIHDESAGWPHLVQLIAEVIVDLLNDRDSRRVSGRVVDEALNKAVQSGDTVLRYLIKGESRLPGEWEYLSGFRRTRAQQLPDDREIISSLERRQLVTISGDVCQVRVPLAQRWLETAQL